MGKKCVYMVHDTEGPMNETYSYHDEYRKKVGVEDILPVVLIWMRENDIVDAFEYADKNVIALLAFTNHDFRNMKQEVDRARNMLGTVS